MTRALAAFLAIVAALVVVGCRADEVPDVYGVRLGMTASDVRDRFTGTGGTFKADVAADDYSIRWTPGPDAALRAKGGGPNPLSVEFAFHMGSLVAISARVPADAPLAKGATYVVTKRSVMKRAANADGGGVAIDVLARECPTHKARAEAIAAEAENAK